MKRVRLLATILIPLFLLTILSFSSQASESPPAPAATVPQAGSTMFIENAGQFAEGARFHVRGGDRTIWLADDAIWITLLGQAEPQPAADPLGLPGRPAEASTPDLGVNLRLSFVGANPRRLLEPFAPLDTSISYFIGDDPDKWAADVPVWGGVRYVDLYPGLDLELGDAGEMRIVCRAASCQQSLGQLQLQVEGAESLVAAEDGLVVDTAAGVFALPWLEVVDQEGRPLNMNRTSPTLMSTVVSKPLADPPPDRPARLLLQNLAYLPLILRPEPLLYSTYMGGGSEEEGNGVAVTGAGEALVTGWTNSTDFPTTPGAFDPAIDASDAFVFKLDATGDGLVYGTFLGGSSTDRGNGIAVDSAGQAYITGLTDSLDFPTTPGAFDTIFDGSDAFVTKLNATGTGLVYSTYVGGSVPDEAKGITVDSAGQAFVAGLTVSTDFPTTPGAFDTTLNDGTVDAFVVKITAAGSALIYGTYLGGSDWDVPFDIALDSAGQAYVTGWTESSDFPTTPAAFDTTFNGAWDSFVAKLNSAGSGLLYSTYLGGNQGDYGEGIAVDDAGNAFVGGSTRSANFPTTPGAFDTVYDGSDAFVVKLNAAGNGLLYGTFLGGEGPESASDVAIDGAGRAFLTGITYSSDFPITPGAFDPVPDNVGFDAFVVQLNATGTAVLYGSFCGGSYEDRAVAVAVDGAGLAYVAGHSDSDDFPTTAGTFDPAYNGSGDVFVIKLLTAY